MAFDLPGQREGARQIVRFDEPRDLREGLLARPALTRRSPKRKGRRDACREEGDGDRAGHDRTSHDPEEAALLCFRLLDLHPTGRELGQQLGRRSIASIRIARERLRDDLLQMWRDVLPEMSDRLGRRGENGAQHGDVVFSGERTPAGQHLVEHDAERPDISACVQRIAARLFRRHVRHGPEHHARSGDVGLARQLREPEVDDLHDAFGRDDQIRRLDVAMDDVGLVGA